MFLRCSLNLNTVSRFTHVYLVVRDKRIIQMFKTLAKYNNPEDTSVPFDTFETERPQNRERST